MPVPAKNSLLVLVPMVFLAAGCTGTVEAPDIIVNPDGQPTFQAVVDKQSSILDRLDLTVTRPDGTSQTRSTEETPNPFQVLGNTYRYGPDQTLNLNLPSSWIVSRWEADFRGIFNLPGSDSTSKTLVDLEVQDVRIVQDDQSMPPALALRQGTPSTLVATVHNASARDLPLGARIVATFVGAAQPSGGTAVSGTVAGPIAAGATVTIESGPFAIVHPNPFVSATVVVAIDTANTNPANDEFNLDAVWQQQ